MSGPRKLLLVELLKTNTEDGLRLDGAWAESAGTTPALSLDAILCLHGVGGNFYDSRLFDALLTPLLAWGVPVVRVNTRGHGSVNISRGRRIGAAYEIVDDCRRDIAAWLERLRQRDKNRVLLIGHSLGAIKALYAAASELQAEIAGVIALSPPRLSYTCFEYDARCARFLESYATARTMVNSGCGDELFTAQFPFTLLITAAAYVDKYGPAERYNIIRFTDRISCPTLFVYGSKELEQGGTTFAGVPEALRQVPDSRGNRQISVIPNADHHYSGVHDSLAARIGLWLPAEFTPPADSTAGPG